MFVPVELKNVQTLYLTEGQTVTVSISNPTSGLEKKPASHLLAALPSMALKIGFFESETNSKKRMGAREKEIVSVVWRSACNQKLVRQCIKNYKCMKLL